VKEFHIVNKARAAATAIVGLALTATGALAAAPHPQASTNASSVSTLAQDKTAVGGTNTNHGGAVSTLAQSLGGSDGTTTDTTTTTTTDTTGAQGAHGAAVSAVAQDQTAVGGPNNNHGGAVSIVARGAHGQSAVHGKSAGKSQSGTHPTTH
jgi:hypothetical protein